MSGGWQRVTKSKPCPICGRPDWCCVGERFINCMRIAGPKPARNGGWLYAIAGAEQRPLPARPARPEPPLHGDALMRTWRRDTTSHQVAALASTLGVTPEALMALDAAWAPPHDAWAFPMTTAGGAVCGIRLRTVRGYKLAVTGGKSGLFQPYATTQTTAYICEGPTTTAALLSLGLFAIGRASCNEGAAMLALLLPKIGVSRAVIVGDNDNDKFRPDGSMFNPGIDGAKRLSGQLPVPNCIWLPPCKDARDYVRHGGTRQGIESALKGMIWRQPQN